MTEKFTNRLVYFSACTVHNDGFVCMGVNDPKLPAYFAQVYQCVDCRMFFVRKQTTQESAGDQFTKGLARLDEAAKGREFGSKAADYAFWLICATVVGYAAISLLFPGAFK